MRVIDDTLITLKTQRDTIETEITAERAAVEHKLADRITALTELNAVIRAIERQQGAGATNGSRAPRGQNRDKILAVIANGPRTTSEIADATGIGRGSAERTLKQLEREGLTDKTVEGWLATRG
ncbi:helix-turn-helix domain-containing protein [Conexibacter sp. JD483]|uniref:helix-turn-helix domain-containing protein n=1 Tax=unclassified Conexibacter TaxID=2627773 RepID=UPI0027260313|nr:MULTISPECIES: helix-turn-helix domain-containing protein [unclassified Conexibacter]MDO8188318.1 helix-turn-helix domain-containing protein [Conexibacter sp. CPCC 205706]MDO8200734.1 helix-turn-helix domain-containing protein [Conexibacter sp. CPCC 205762]MDR9369458.1 helix-turn-helix domain-containing protein [Conexibacter sp. JD483]